MEEIGNPFAGSLPFGTRATTQFKLPVPITKQIRPTKADDDFPPVRP